MPFGRPVKGYCIEVRFPKTNVNDERKSGQIEAGTPKEETNAERKEDVQEKIEEEEPFGRAFSRILNIAKDRAR